jgi:hypothetical protein
MLAVSTIKGGIKVRNQASTPDQASSAKADQEPERKPVLAGQ